MNTSLDRRELMTITMSSVALPLPVQATTPEIVKTSRIPCFQQDIVFFNAMPGQHPVLPSGYTDQPDLPVLLLQQLGELAPSLNTAFALPQPAGVLFWDDPPERPNAGILRGSPWPDASGTVAFGMNLLRQEFGKRGGAITGVAAHEWAHLYQINNGYEERLQPACRSGDSNCASIRLVELHADFMAGWFFGAAVGDLRRHIEHYLQSLFEHFDDRAESGSYWHGDNLERTYAMMRGFAAALGGLASAQEAAEVGERVVRDPRLSIG